MTLTTEKQFAWVKLQRHVLKWRAFWMNLGAVEVLGFLDDTLMMVLARG